MLKVLTTACLALSCVGCATGPASAPGLSTDCSFQLTTAPFVAKDHHISYDTEGTIVMAIDGAEYSGSDGDVPETEIRSIAIQVGSVNYSLPAGAFANMFNPHVDCPAGCTLKCTSPFALRLRGGDGAGAYDVEWTVDGATTSTVIRRIWQYPEPEQPDVSEFRLEATR